MRRATCPTPVPSKPLGALEGILDDIVDPMIGIVRHIHELARDPGAADLFHYAARVADTAAFGYPANFGHTGGASIDKERAIAKAIGEAIERYCAAMFDANDMPLTSAGSGDLPCIAPGSFTLYLPAQYCSPGFPYVPFNDETRLRWTQMIDLTTGRVAFAPAAFVWVPYQYSISQGEQPIGQPISTGLACHETPAKAALTGLCEVIERDAFTIFWQARISPPRIPVETLPEAICDFVRRFEATGDEVHLFDLTTDVGVPTALGVLRSRSTARPAHVFAAAADVDPGRAVTKALEELDHTRLYTVQILHHVQAPPPDNEFEGVYQQVHHLRLAAEHANVHRFAFVFESSRRVDFAELPSLVGRSPEDDLAALARALTAAGLTPYVADLTSADVRELGLSVVRALVPGMHPLAIGHRVRARGGRRLYEVPQKCGHPGLTFGAPDNPFPHPYP